MRPELQVSLRRLSCALALAVAALPAAAQNLIPNGTFDDDIAGWDVFAEELAPSWSALDAQGAPFSGSLRVVNSDTFDNNAFPSAVHCVPVVAGEPYRGRGSFFYPAGQAHAGVAAVIVFFFSETNCNGDVLGHEGGSRDLTPGAWQIVDTGGDVAPPGAVSASVGFGFRKVGNGGGPVVFHLDDASFAVSDPAPPAGEWLEVPDLPGFRFKVRVTPAGGSPAPGTQVDDCVPETVCVAGALPTRSEVFLRVIGPRPNGYLWPQIVRFTISQVEVWVEQLSTGQVNYYVLAALPPSTDVLPGLNDRTGFLP